MWVWVCGGCTKQSWQSEFTMVKAVLWKGREEEVEDRGGKGESRERGWRRAKRRREKKKGDTGSRAGFSPEPRLTILWSRFN